ncbi:MAG: hypothetical protein HYS13_04830 [Planctomycetia bacterium]|nr:hypothetical protein [Planctomycetia bacterium]
MNPAPLMTLRLRFPAKDIPQLAARYSSELNDRDRRLTTILTDEVFPAYEQQGFLTKQQFVKVCEWKSPRPKRRFESNDADLIREVSTLARTTTSERMRIQVWTLLDGVNWPTASVFLHFAFPDKYPILDVRALWSLGVDHPPVYNFPFWCTYTDACRSLARSAKVTMRELDEALWKYSQANQGKPQQVVTPN